MKQHDLLLLLCEVCPHVFAITVSFKEKAVTIQASKPTWSKTLSYEHYVKNSNEYLAKEILDDYSNATTAGKARGA